MPRRPDGRATLPLSEPLRDRMEEADRDFFERVENGYKAIAAAEPRRVCVIDSTQPLATVRAAIWLRVEPLLAEAKKRRTSR